MIRLYPQVVRGETDIKALRRQLRRSQHEYETRCDRISDAAHHVDDLHVEIDELEKEELALKEQLAKAEADAVSLAELATEAEVQDLAMLQRLGGCEEESIMVLHSLAGCEMESSRQWWLVDEHRRKAEEIIPKIPSPEIEQELRIRMAELDRSYEELEQQWPPAVEAARLQVAQLEELAAAALVQNDSAAMEEAAAARVQEMNVQLECEASELWMMVNHLEGRDSWAVSLRDLIIRQVYEGRSLRAKLAAAQDTGMQVYSELAATLDKGEELRKLVAHEKVLWDDLKLKAVQCDERTEGLRQQLQECQAQCDDVNQHMRETEFKGKSQETRLRKELSVVTSATDRLEGETGDLTFDIEELKAKLRASDDALRKLSQLLSAGEMMSKGITERKAQLHNEFTEMKSKMRCVIS